MPSHPEAAAAAAHAEAVRHAQVGLYAPPAPDGALWWPAPLIQARLTDVLIGIQLTGAPRTRNKLAKDLVVDALGYRGPGTYQRVTPRLTAAHLDVIVQKSRNVQPCNDGIVDDGRYAIVHVDDVDVIRAVRVIDGAELAGYQGDVRTGKHQARVPGGLRGVTGSGDDTARFAGLYAPTADALRWPSPAPVPGTVLPLDEIRRRCAGLIGTTIPLEAAGRQRVEGAAAVDLVADALGVGPAPERRTCPDLPGEAVEVKLVRGGTINLGVHDPADTEPSDKLFGLAPADLRYVVVSVRQDENVLVVDAVTVTTGAAFFGTFRRCPGTNSKTQGHLPAGFFGDIDADTPTRDASNVAQLALF